MKWGLILARHDVTLRTSTGVERHAKASEPQPHILSPHNNYYHFIIFHNLNYLINAHHTHFLKTSKTRVNSTRFQAI